MHDPACDDFRRTDAQRRSLADRPVSRRRLLQLGLGATLSVYAARTAPLRDALQAAEAAAASTPQAPVLVTVFVPGGLDLLDTVVPVADYGRYADLRPGLKVAAPLELAGTGVGLHPSLGTGLGGGLKGLFDRGRLGLLPGIDYADPTSRTPTRATSGRPGWSRSATARAGSDAGWTATAPRTTRSRASRSRASSRRCCAAPARPSPRCPRPPTPRAGSPASGTSGRTLPAVPCAWPPGAAGGRAGRGLAAARQSRRVADALEPYAKVGNHGPDPLAPPVAYPATGDRGGALAERLQVLAGLLAQPLGIRIATVEADGDFDTHDDQRASLTRDLGSLSGARAPSRPTSRHAAWPTAS